MGISRETSLREMLTEHEERHKRFLDDYRKKSKKLLEALLPNIETSTLRGLPELGFTFAEKLIAKIGRREFVVKLKLKRRRRTKKQMQAARATAAAQKVAAAAAAAAAAG